MPKKSAAAQKSESSFGARLGRPSPQNRNSSREVPGFLSQLRKRSSRLGRLGEIWVGACLEDRGYRIVDRNTRVGAYEIDLIASRRKELLFVEVKTRRSSQRDPFLAFDTKKRRRQLRAARRWLTRADVRFPAQLVIAAVRFSPRDNPLRSASEKDFFHQVPQIRYRVIPIPMAR